MKIAIDMDGTLWQHMGFFRHFMKAMLATGHEVGIMTVHSPKIEERDLALLKSRKFPTPSFFLNTSERNKGESQGKWKARMMNKHSIDYLFDDFSYGDVKMKEEFTAVHPHMAFHVPCREPKNHHFE